jgi:hypothetical protein
VVVKFDDPFTIDTGVPVVGPAGVELLDDPHAVEIATSIVAQSSRSIIRMSSTSCGARLLPRCVRVISAGFQRVANRWAAAWAYGTR